MTASRQIGILSVRLPAGDLRRFKSLAASRGVTLQQAVQEALRAWASPSKMADVVPLHRLRGSLAGFNVDKVRREERQFELAKDKARM
jgi:hypothetical protein